jgi:hypothetical protein
MATFLLNYLISREVYVGDARQKHLRIREVALTNRQRELNWESYTTDDPKTLNAIITEIETVEDELRTIRLELYGA